MKRRDVVVGAGSIVSLVMLVVACGTTDSTFGDGNPNGPSPFENDGSFGSNTADGGDPYANDPPPKWCGAAGQPTPPTPGGTAECPDDKNKPGCGCNNVGDTAACWTGLRTNRGLGVCKDGVTKCVQKSENVREWGPCEGEVLPTSGATKGAPACKCFSKGQWNIKNLVPCGIYTVGDEAHPYEYSAGTKSDGSFECTANTVPPTKPAGTWSENSLNVDCAGHFRLCYAIKAGDMKTASASDCTLAQVCTEADYIKENVEQNFPPLDSWASPDSACALKFSTTGGYGEMTVKGLSVRCDNVDDGAGNPFVFNRVQYCPSKCQKPENASAPECVNCKQDGSGQF